MKRKELKILGLSCSQNQIGSYVCVLSEKRGLKKIPIIIKNTEAQRIALEIEGIKSPKVLTHDIFKGICDSFQLDVQEVYIYALLEGIFYTKIILSNGIDEIEVETPTGDGIAISTIFKCPIYTTIDILNQVGIQLNDDGSTPETDDIDEDGIDDDFDSFIDDDRTERVERVVSTEDLENLMQSAIENEEYEIAAELRDRIQNLKNKKN
jgi:bifunctional DNase/RNase